MLVYQRVITMVWISGINKLGNPFSSRGCCRTVDPNGLILPLFLRMEPYEPRGKNERNHASANKPSKYGDKLGDKLTELPQTSSGFGHGSIPDKTQIGLKIISCLMTMSFAIFGTWYPHISIVIKHIFIVTTHGWLENTLFVDHFL